MKYPVFIVSSLLMLALITMISCTGGIKGDAVSGASKKNKPVSALPPKVGQYTSLGELPGLKSFAVKYDAKLIRGGEPYNKKAPATITKLKVKTIVTIVPTKREKAMCKKLNIKLVEMVFDKKGPSKEQIAQFLKTMTADKAPTYVHCHGGTHRAGVLGVAYRLYICKWPLDKALLEYGYLGGSLKDDYPMIKAVIDYKK